MKSALLDFGNIKIPLIFLLSLISIVLAIITRVFYTVFTSVLENTGKHFVTDTRYSDLAKNCFSLCESHNEGNTITDRINKCFVDRHPSEYFNQVYIEPYCKYFLSYLGLD